jgi:hypothetical protein
MAWPDAYHWYLRVTPDGPQLPACSVSVSPALIVPVIVGVAAVRVPAATLEAAAEVASAYYRLKQSM